LRLPGTMNRKPGLDPVPVRLLHLDGRLRYNPDDFDWLPPVEEESAAPGRDKCGAIRPLHGPGATPLLAPILNGCAWMRHCRDDAAALGEPEWYAMLGIAGRCRDGAAAAHALSQPHPGYSPQETAEKLSHALEAAGPRTCQSIRSDLDAQPYCAACPHRGKIRSPIVLGMRAAD